MSHCKRLPPGWDTKLEPRSGKSYFINYFTKNVSLDDPRIKENPDPNVTFEVQNSTSESVRPNVRHVPLMGASAVQSTSQAAAMNETVAKIRTMFPTVPETHIKALLIKYHGREAVVVSALQVEKHPVRTPGPFTPPPPARAPLPLICRPQPKPHSPKMKLRYLKSVFPVVEETLLLDTLCNADNNVTHATERLLNLGFSKRDTPQPRVSLRKMEVRFKSDEVVKSPDPVVRLRSPEDKQKLKERLCKKHPEVPEKVISIALDSASFNEETAEVILNNMEDEKLKRKRDTLDEITEQEQVIQESAEVKTEAVPTTPDTSEITFRPRTKGINPKDRTPTNEVEKQETLKFSFISPHLSKPQGPNKDILRGPNDAMLLDDYIPWKGAQRKLAKGPDRSLVCGSQGAKGPDLSLRRGSVPCLARGSMFSPLIRGN